MAKMSHIAHKQCSQTVLDEASDLRMVIDLRVMPAKGACHKGGEPHFGKRRKKGTL
jgi:hypothetical protein